MGSRKRGKQATPPPDLEVTVLESLRAAPGVTVAALKKHVPVSHKKFVTEMLIQSLADRGEVFFVRKGKRTFPREPFAEIDARLPAHTAQEPIEKSLLKELVGEAAPGYEAVFDDWLKRALADRRLFEHAAAKPKGKKRLGREPDINSSLKSALKALKTALAKLDAQGVRRERVAETLLGALGLHREVTLVDTKGASKASTSRQGVPTDVRTRFLSALESLVSDNPRDALHSVRALRSRAGLAKQEFDMVAIELAREGVVSLHHHDHAAGLPEAERLQLIQDDRGTYFNGIAPRRGHD